MSREKCGIPKLHACESKSKFRLVRKYNFVHGAGAFNKNVAIRRRMAKM